MWRLYRKTNKKLAKAGQKNKMLLYRYELRHLYLSNEETVLKSKNRKYLVTFENNKLNKPNKKIGYVLMVYILLMLLVLTF